MAKDKYGLKIPGKNASLSEKQAYLERVERRKEAAKKEASIDAKIKQATKK